MLRLLQHHILESVETLNLLKTTSPPLVCRQMWASDFTLSSIPCRGLEVLPGTLSLHSRVLFNMWSSLSPCQTHSHSNLILDLGWAHKAQAHRRKGTFHQQGWQISRTFKRGRKPDTTPLPQLLLTPTNCLLHNRRKMLPLSPSQVFPCVLHAQAPSSWPRWGASFMSRER